MRLLALIIAKILLQVGSLSIAAVAITEGVTHKDMRMVGGGTLLIVSLLVDARKNHVWFQL